MAQSTNPIPLVGAQESMNPPSGLTPAPPATPQASSPAFTPPTPPAVQAPQAHQGPTRKTLTGDEDGIPDDVDIIEMSRTALKKRLDRFSRSQLKQAFGTENPDEILAWKRQAEEYKARDEAAKLAQMTEAERYRTQYEQQQQESAHWKTQYEQLQEQHMLREQDRQVMSIASRHVDPDCLDYVTMQLAQHLQSVDEDEMRDPQAYIDGWVKNYVAEHPKFGSAPPPAPAPAGIPAGVQSVQMPQPAPRQVPMHNGPSTGRPANSVPQFFAQKTAAPGLPNSMNQDEWLRHKREMGYTF